MFTFLITLAIIVALFLVLVVLIQNSYEGGLSSQFGGAGVTQLIGVKKTGNLLEKITWGLAITLFVLTLTAAIFQSQKANQDNLRNSPNIERAEERKSLLPSPDLNQKNSEPAEKLPPKTPE